MGNCDGARWAFDIKRDGNPSERAQFLIKLEEDELGNLKATEIRDTSERRIQDAELRRGTCIPAVVSGLEFRVMILELVGIPFGGGEPKVKKIKLRGTAVGPQDRSNFVGSYRNADEPGDTGTGGGSQTPLRLALNQEKDQEYEG